MFKAPDMMDINMIIANNILDILERQGRKQVDLADGISVSEQVVRKMLTGNPPIKSGELERIADYLKVSKESLLQIPEAPITTEVIHTLMDRVETDEAREALKIADEVSDLIIFHGRVRKNGSAMMRSAET